MMNFNEFKAYVAENVLAYLPLDYEEAKVSIEEVVKNNGITMEAVVIRKEEVNISPTIYLDGFYKDYNEGRELTEIMHEISNMQMNYAVETSIDISMLMDFEKVKDKILPRIVNAKENEVMLKHRPHIIVEDLAVIYQVEMGRTEDGIMSTAVHNQMFENYGISIEELHKTALSNIEPVMKPKLMSMREMLGTMIPEGMDKDMLPEEDPTGMHILTCDSKNYGAAVILDVNTMEAVSEKFGNYFILPSSVHECIILPDDGNADVESLEALVQEVNGSQVSEQEVVSSQVYRYDRKAKKICFAA